MIDSDLYTSLRSFALGGDEDVAGLPRSPRDTRRVGVADAMGLHRPPCRVEDPLGAFIGELTREVKASSDAQGATHDLVENGRLAFIWDEAGCARDRISIQSRLSRDRCDLLEGEAVFHAAYRVG